MRPRSLVIGISGIAVLGALTVSTSAQASGPPTSATSPPGQVLTSPQQVRLVTGDVVRLGTTPDGRSTTQIIKAQQAGPGSVFRTYVQGGHEYVVPQSAVPYLGTRLDAGLFDVTSLAQHPASNLSVRVHLRAGGSAASVTGLTVRTRSGSTVAGSFTAAAAKEFGRALAQQSMRDHASPTHLTGLFRGIKQIAPAVRVPMSPASPATPADSTLTVHGINWAGDLDNGDSYNIYNVDDLSLFAQGITFVNGQAQVTVPNGNYSAVGFFYDFATGTIYQNTLAQFTVKGDTDVTIDARDATAPASITTPKDSVTFSNAMGIGRADAKGVAGSYSFTAGDQPFLVKPIKKAPSVGKLYYYFYKRAFSAAAKGTKAYSYDLKYGSTGTISKDQTYAPTTKSLAAIDSTYAADHTGQQSLDARFAAFPWETFLLAADATHTAPTTRTEYYTADKTLEYSGVDYQVYVPDPFTLIGEIDSSWRTYKAGYTASATWGDDPTHPRLLEHDIFINQTVCPACIAGSTLDGLVFPFGDSTPDHRTYSDAVTAGLSETSNWSVSSDGDIVQQGTGVMQAAAQVGSGHLYTIDYDTTRSSDDFSLSSKTSTTWTIPAGAPQADLPQGWTCTVSGGTDCSVLGLMISGYDLPSDSLGRIKSGDVKATITLGHLADLKSKVRSLKVKVSFDGGDTYTNATVKANGAGEYSVAFTVPPKGQTDGYGAISITAKDDLKGTLHETVINAFAVK